MFVVNLLLIIGYFIYFFILIFVEHIVFIVDENFILFHYNYNYLLMLKVSLREFVMEG